MKHNQFTVVLALVVALCALRCQDQGGTTEEVGDATTNNTAVGADTGLGVDGSGPTATSAVDGSGGGDSDSSVIVPGPGCEVTQTVERIEWLPTQRADRLVDVHSAVVLQSADEFREFVGFDPPPEIRYPDEWAVLVHGPRVWPRGTVAIRGIEYCSDGSYHVDGGPRSISGDECTVVERSAWSMPALYKFPAFDYRVEPDGPIHNPDDLERVECDADSAAAAEPCTLVAEPCQPGLYCAGLTRGFVGVCVDDAHLRTVENRDATAVPDGDSAGVEIPNTIANVPGITADIIVDASIDHPQADDLTITLITPTGREIALWNKEAPDFGSLGLSRAPIDVVEEDPNGIWRLKLVDDVPGNQGEVDSWTLILLTRD